MANRTPQPNQSVTPATGGGTIGSRLRELRARRNLQQIDIAAAMSVSRPTVSEWEKDKKKPDREHLRMLAVYFRTTMRWLIEGGKEPIVIDDPAEAERVAAIRAAPENIQAAIDMLLAPYLGQTKTDR